MRFMQIESVLQTKNRSEPAKNRFSVALPTVQLMFYTPVYEVYWGYIVFVFSVTMFVGVLVCVCKCVNFFFRQRFLRNY